MCAKPLNTKAESTVSASDLNGIPVETDRASLRLGLQAQAPQGLIRESSPIPRSAFAGGRDDYFAKASSRWRMMRAKTRSDLLTASLLGKTLATSDSSLTRFVPCANRRAYLPRTPREKSYSARISGLADFLAAFFIRSSFSFVHAPRADHAEIIAPLRVNDNQQFPPVRLAEDDEPALGLRMSRVGNGQRQRVAKHHGGFFKADAMLGQV